MEKKDTIFFSHSFDEKAPAWSTVSDAKIAESFAKLLKKRWHVESGTPNLAQPIGDKVVEAIDKSRATIAIFTGKSQIQGIENKFCAPPWVLCECSYALGRFKHGNYIVAGFREKGVDPQSLAMVTAGGMEVPEFDRNDLDGSATRINRYLNDLEKRMKQGDPGQVSFLDPPYVQKELQKIFIIYRNGFGTVQNIATILIKDPDRFMGEGLMGKIEHRIWAHNGKFPSLNEMKKVTTDNRKRQAFFNAKLNSHSGGIGTHLFAEEVAHDDTEIRFNLNFMQGDGSQLKVKANDTIKYQYAWGIPNMFRTVEEDFEPVVPNVVNTNTYDLAEFEANHGKISRLEIEVRFERESSCSEEKQLFSKSPFYSTTHSFATNPAWSPPTDLEKHSGDPDEYDMWYQIYKFPQKKDFDGKVRIAWRPSSDKTQT